MDDKAASIVMQPSDPEDKRPLKEPPKYDGEQLRSKHREILQHLQETGKLPQSVKAEVMHHEAQCSRRSLRSLDSCTIPEMQVGVLARDSFLLLKTVEEPYFDGGISTLVEDHSGVVYPLVVFNYVSSLAEPNPGDHLPVGTIFVLKEPTLRFRGTMCVICCDTPTDIIVLSISRFLESSLEGIDWVHRDHPMPSTFVEFRERSVSHYKQNKYHLSLEMDREALRLVSEGDRQSLLLVHLNIAFTSLQVRRYEEALSHATEALKIDPVNQNGNHIAGKAHYELGQFDKAQGYFQNKLSCYKRNKPCIEELDQCTARMKEADGDVSAERIYLEYVRKPGSELDCANYVGPLKRLSTNEWKRGVVATEDIMPGTLLVVAKSVVNCFIETQPSNTEQFRPEKAFHELVAQVSQLVLRNPETFGNDIYDLPVDDALLDVTKPELYSSVEDKELVVDVERIRHIVASNCITIKPYSQKETTFGLGLFGFPSYFNHSCMANASLDTFNNIAIIHASRYIRADEEVTLSHCEPTSPLAVKEEFFDRKQFRCTCRLCETDRKDSEVSRNMRSVLIDHCDLLFRKHFKAGTWNEVDLNKFSDLVSAIEFTYKEEERQDMQFAISKPYTYLSYLYGSGLDMTNALIYSHKAIVSLGFNIDQVKGWSQDVFVVPDDALFTRGIFLPLRIMIGILNRLNDIPGSQLFLQSLVKAENMLSGAGASMIKARLEEFPESLC